MNPHERKVSFKEWRPSKNAMMSGAEMLGHGCLRLLTNNPRRTFARVEAELRKGRIVSTFANMTMLVLGPHHDSPYVQWFDEDMKQYNRRIS